ncbi:hypothetical protein SLEP1_g2703 [Rubroshorea leprosula]|uniref:Uncharacterized protein n=1 Tax=Rubroshorea leprosula TaxID=152421 RepID=A0AAV5HTV6_9ROSI|nr:hypothetical protein SLEP1_g2703 [Rubroshorea leprosula]
MLIFLITAEEISMVLRKGRKFPTKFYEKKNASIPVQREEIFSKSPSSWQRNSQNSINCRGNCHI